LEAQGDAHYHLEDFREARLQYQGAVSRGGRSAVLESKLGACEVRLGLRNQGLRRIEQAVASEPHFPELYDILIAAALFAGDAHLAAHAARGRLHVGDPAPEDFLQAAGLLAPLGDLNAVREVVQAGCERYPNSENLRLAIIEVDNARSQALAGHNVAV
jgi:hypothetical protein